MSPVCKMADNGRLTVDQKVKVVLFYAETKSVVATRRRFRAHFGTRCAPCKQTIYRLSLGTIFQPVRINSVPDVKCFCNNKNVLCVQSVVWHFVRHPVFLWGLLGNAVGWGTEGCGFDCCWCHWNVRLTMLWQCGDSVSIRYEYQGGKGGRYVGLIAV